MELGPDDMSPLQRYRGCYVVEPLIKDTLNKDQCTNLYSGNTSERGNNGQNDPSQCVRYSEVPLYMNLV